MPKRVLFIRLDKIGDLVCTLCSDEHPGLKEYSVHWLISKGLEFIPENSVPKRNYSSLTKDIQGAQFLFHFLKANKFEAAVSFQCPWWVHALLFFFRVPIRVGVLSKWHSFLFLNAGVRQKRSQSDRHESDYNFELVNVLTQKISGGFGTANFSDTPVLRMEIKNASSLIEEWNLKPHSYFVVHPGMSGSALNWSQEKYIEFIRWFHVQYPAYKIILTGTQSDSEYLDKIIQNLNNEDFFKNLQSSLNPTDLLCLLSLSSGLLAPSTGVLHLAAALGVPTFGIFSPVRVQRATRWSPRGPNVNAYQSESLESSVHLDSLDIREQFKIDFEKTLVRMTKK